MKKYILAYDLGTGGNKASLYDQDLNLVSNNFISYETHYPNIGWHEQRPNDWWEAVIKSTRNLLESSGIDKNSIECLSISGHSLGVVPIGKNGELLQESTPIWSDARAKEQADKFFNRIDQDEWFQITGNGFAPENYSVFKIMWYRDSMPEMFNKIHKIVGTKDFVNYKLTGKILTDYSYASGSGVFNLKEWDYSPHLMEASDLSSNIFPRIVPSTNVIGKITEKASKITGLPRDVKVICGGVDNSCMALGAKSFKEGRIYTSLGSSAWIAISSKQPVIDVKNKAYTFAHVIPGMYTSAYGSFSAGSSYKWVKNNLLINQGEENKITYKQLDSLAKKSPVGAKKLIFNPNLAGGSAAHPSPNIRGAFLGLDLSHKTEDIIRATLEGVALDLRILLDFIREKRELADEMLIVGGGTKSNLWMQIFADVYDMEVIKTNIGQNAGSLGAAAIAAVGAGLWKNFDKIDEIHKILNVAKPLKKNVERYNKLLVAFKYSNKFLSQLGNILSQINF